MQGSTDGITWTNLTTITGISDGNQWYVFPLSATSSQPMIRLLDNHSGFSNLAEVQLLKTP